MRSRKFIPLTGASLITLVIAAAVAVTGCGGSSSGTTSGSTPLAASPADTAPAHTKAPANPAATPSASPTYAWQQPSGAPSPGKSPAATSNAVCSAFTTAEEQSILGGNAVQGSKASYGGAGGDVCTFGSGPVQTSSGTKYHFIAVAQLQCKPSMEIEAWNAYRTGGLPLRGDPYGVRSLSGTGTNDGIRLRDGCVFSSTVGLSGTTGKVLLGSEKALQSAMDAVYARTG